MPRSSNSDGGPRVSRQQPLVKALFDDREEVAAGVPGRVVTPWRAAALASVIAHLAIGAASLSAMRSGAPLADEGSVGRVYPLPEADAPIIVELPPMQGDVAMVATPEPVPSPAVPSPAVIEAGGAKTAQVDNQAGKGGDVTAAMRARNLAARAEDETTTVTHRDAIDAEQENRLKTGKQRASRIDVRYALEPMELTFVASGKGFRYERHPVAKSDASTGVASGKGSSAGVTALGQGLPINGEGAPKTLGGAAVGSVSSPKAGAAYGVVGMPSEVGANVAKGRPHVLKGKPNVTADSKASASDTTDSDQAVAAALKSVVSNSTSGAVAIADGKGGSGGGNAPGSGGKSGEGSTSMALGSGSGAVDGPHAIERTSWFAALQKRLGPLMRDAFPREREMDLRNGTVIVDLVIAKGGSVVDVIVVRPSGFDDFDQNVVTRMRAAGALDPVPDLLSKGSITVRVPVHGGWRLQ